LGSAACSFPADHLNRKEFQFFQVKIKLRENKIKERREENRKRRKLKRKEN
jgi:hypothetical protein